MDRISRKEIRDAVLNETTHTRELFLAAFPAATEEFTARLADVYDHLADLDNVLPRDTRTAWVQAFMFSSSNSLLTSFHLLIRGFLIPAGNLMRHWSEGLSMALLCCDSRIASFRILEANPTRFPVQKATDLVMRKNNAQILGINKRAWLKFQQINDLYQKYSHASAFSLASMFMMSREGGVIIGSEFDHGKLKAYDKEIKLRTSACTLLLNAATIIEQHLMRAH
jgi:hypothetical protein